MMIEAQVILHRHSMHIINLMYYMVIICFMVEISTIVEMIYIVKINFQNYILYTPPTDH